MPPGSALGRNPKNERQVQQLIRECLPAIEAGSSVAPLLPFIFNLHSQPYSLNWSHFVFEPFFKVRNMARRMVYLCARQVGKSQSQAAAQILRARLQPFYNILTVLPFYEQTRRFSHNYVRPLLAASPIKSKLVDRSKADGVLQRELANGSSLYYSYSSGDPSRARGIPASEDDFDEIQDLDIADLPVIEQCMGASPFKVVRYTGTPKTLDNTAHLLWEDSSQAHWHIPCPCGKLNRAHAGPKGDDGDLLNMIGPHTLICAQCAEPLESRAGFWVHDYPERQMLFAGYHVPQPILPLHYENPSNWAVLREYQRDRQPYIFFNEILGESYDSGAKIITKQQMLDACVCPPLSPGNMRHDATKYVMTALGIDWGGRGKEKPTDSEDFISNTAMALAGIDHDGRVDIRWLHKVPYAIDSSLEPEMAVNVAADAQCDWIALDYGGQGNVQENAMLALGWPRKLSCPFTYCMASPRRPIVFFEKPAHGGVRSSYSLDKHRSILLLCELIKRGVVRLPNHEKWMSDHLLDFMNIFEEVIDNPRGSPSRMVRKMSRRTDDIVHAINFACMCLFHATNSWPALAEAFIDRA